MAAYLKLPTGNFITANPSWFSHTSSFHELNHLRQSGLAHDQKVKLLWPTRACCSVPSHTKTTEDENKLSFVAFIFILLADITCVS